MRKCGNAEEVDHDQHGAGGAGKANACPSREALTTEESVDGTEHSEVDQGPLSTSTKPKASQANAKQKKTKPKRFQKK